MAEQIQASIITFVLTTGPKLLWIVVLFFAGRVVLKRVVNEMVKLTTEGDQSDQRSTQKRAETLGKVGIATGNIVIYVIVLLMILDVFGVDIRPILAGAGIIGLAVGFGAQSLVKDFVSGLFILIENQYGVGDKVKIGAFEGTVAKVTMRSTVLRDDEGAFYYIANGSINNVINYSRK